MEDLKFAWWLFKNSDVLMIILGVLSLLRTWTPLGEAGWLSWYPTDKDLWGTLMLVVVGVAIRAVRIILRKKLLS